MQIVTPQQGSIWLTETSQSYLIRWQYLGLPIYADSFSINLLDATSLSPVAVVYSNSRSFFNDTSLTGKPLNATNWVIPSSLSNRRVKLQWVGNVVDQSTLKSILADSGTFTIGPSAIRNDAQKPLVFSPSTTILVLLMYLLQ